MTTRKLKICGIVTVLLLLLAGCGGDGGEGEGPPDKAPPESPKAPVDPPKDLPEPSPSGRAVSLSGTAKDHSTGNAVAGATVSVIQYVGTTPMTLGTTTTDSSGAYALQVNANPGRVTVKVEADKFAPQAVVVDVTKDTTAASADLVHVPVDVVRDALQPTDGIEIRNQDHVLVSVPANGLVTASGDNPVGSVRAEVTVLDPSVDPSVMPGDFMALDASTGRLRPIESFGALDIRFRDGNGAALTVRAGQTARIWIPLATDKDPASAPATMPLFYWSDERGHWIEDGSSTLMQVEPAKWAYVGNVSHFTYWNADVAFESVQVSGCVEDSGMRPVASVRVTATGVDYNGRSSGVTDANGRFDVPVRPNSQVLLEVENSSFSRTISTGDEGEDMALSPCLMFNAFRLDVSSLDDPGAQLR